MTTRPVLAIDIGYVNLVLSSLSKDNKQKICGIYGDENYKQPNFDFDEENKPFICQRNKGYPIFYKSEFFNSDDIKYPTLPEIQLAYLSIPISSIFSCIFKQAKSLFPYAKDIIILVPNSCKQWHQDFLSKIIQQIFQITPIFSPSCVSGALNFVKQDSEIVTEKLNGKQTFNALYINFGAYYGDCVAFSVNQQREVQFLQTKSSYNYVIDNIGQLTYEDILLRFQNNKKTEKIRKQISKFKGHIIDNINTPNIEQIELLGLNQVLSEDLLITNFNSEDDENLMYDDNIIYVDEIYLKSRQKIIDSKVQALLNQVIKQFLENDISFDIIIGSGGYLVNNTGVINKFVNFELGKSLIQMKPFISFCATGGSLFNLFTQIKIQEKTIDIYYCDIQSNSIEHQNIIQRGQEFQFQYNGTIVMESLNQDIKIAVVESFNNKSEIYFVQIQYCQLNSKSQFDFNYYMYTYSPDIYFTYSQDKQQQKYCNIIKYKKHELQYDFTPQQQQILQTLKSKEKYICFLIFSIQQLDNIYVSHQCLQIQQSPQNIYHVMLELSQQLSSFDTIHMVLKQLDSNKIESILQKFIQYDLQQYEISEQIIQNFLSKHIDKLITQTNGFSLCISPTIQIINEKLTLISNNSTYIPVNIKYPYQFNEINIIMQSQTQILVASDESSPFVYVFQLSSNYKAPLASILIKQVLLDENVLPYLINQQFLLYHLNDSSQLILNMTQTISNFNQIQQYLNKIAILIPFLGNSLIYYHAKQKCYAEIISDGCNKYSLVSYSVINLKNQFSENDPGISSRNPNIYNLSSKLLNFLASNSLIYLLNKDIRLSVSLDQELINSHIVPDTTSDYIFNGSSKIFVITQIILPLQFVKINFNTSPKEGIKVNYAQLFNCNLKPRMLCCECDNEPHNGVFIPTIMPSGQIELFSIGRDCAIKDFSNEYIARPLLQLFPQYMEEIDDQIVFPIISLGQVMFGLQLQNCKKWIQQALSYNLVTSQTTPCCPTHKEAAQQIPGDAFYQKCPISSCHLHFCDYCFNWHERINPYERKCTAGMIQCPNCKIIGERDDKCLVTTCICQVHFCTFPDCGKWYKKYKDCENHVFTHKRGIGIYERGNSSDTKINAAHL
ncbi:hypothetical protein SS50377_27525 [Spironucleus salmonicida]|uniref:C2H2-type domain-containing protein n=1 Tax=Spironucleus salmonicida TaxID=348837 RepID=V6LQD4_9EUKA|nr:hypothetical protein SS50377_27525 [Spironucleus salmonicida]|eukprot:EST46882.1 Hypothetical protein SS50377_13034 [Spironucleus salmonicida]